MPLLTVCPSTPVDSSMSLTVPEPQLLPELCAASFFSFHHLILVFTMACYYAVILQTSIQCCPATFSPDLFQILPSDIDVVHLCASPCSSLFLKYMFSTVFSVIFTKFIVVCPSVFVFLTPTHHHLSSLHLHALYSLLQSPHCLTLLHQQKKTFPLLRQMNMRWTCSWIKDGVSRRKEPESHVTDQVW